MWVDFCGGGVRRGLGARRRGRNGRLLALGLFLLFLDEEEDEENGCEAVTAVRRVLLVLIHIPFIRVGLDRMAS